MKDGEEPLAARSENGSLVGLLDRFVGWFILASALRQKNEHLSLNVCSDFPHVLSTSRKPFLGLLLGFAYIRSFRLSSMPILVSNRIAPPLQFGCKQPTRYFTRVNQVA